MSIAIDEPIGEDDLLWHYTDGAALLNIVNNGVLWATQIQYMNDAQELIHIVEEMRAALELLSDAAEDDFRFVETLAQALGSAAELRVCVLSFRRTATISTNGAATPHMAMATQLAIAPETYRLGCERSTMSMRKRGGRSTPSFIEARSRTLSVRD